MHLVGARVEGAVDLRAVGFGGVHGLDGVGRQPGGHGVDQGAHRGLALGPDPDPVLLRVARGAAGGLAVGVRVAPALLGLGGVLVGVERAEDLEALLGRERDVHLVGLHGEGDGVGQALHSLDAGAEQRLLAAKVDEGVGVGIRERVPDLVQAELELPVEQDPLQPLDVGVPVPAIPGLGAARRAQQPDRVVVVEGADRDARQPGDGAHGQRSRPVHRGTIDPDVT